MPPLSRLLGEKKRFREVSLLFARNWIKKNEKNPGRISKMKCSIVIISHLTALSELERPYKFVPLVSCVITFDQNYILAWDF